MLRLWILSSLLFLCPISSFSADYDKDAKSAIERALKKDEESSVYREAYQKAVSEGKPLIVWVGTVCLKCEREMSWAVHCRLDVFESESTPRVIVAKETAEGEMRKVKVFHKIPTSQEVQEVLNPSPQVFRQQQPPQQYFYNPPQQQCPS